MSAVFEDEGGVAVANPATMVQWPKMRSPYASVRSTIVSNVQFTIEKPQAPPPSADEQWRVAIEAMKSLIVRFIKLHNEEHSNRLVAALRDFSLIAPRFITRSPPQVFVDEDGELCIEWVGHGRHAIATFSGDTAFGYALLQGDRFSPGNDARLNTPEAERAAAAILAYISGE